MPHLICYDISKNALRNKIAKSILAAGLDRINKSVYLGTISKRSLTLLEKQMSQLMATRAAPQDSLILIPVQAQQVHDMRVLGHNELDKEELTGTKLTLMIQGEEVEETLEATIEADIVILKSPTTPTEDE